MGNSFGWKARKKVTVASETNLTAALSSDNVAPIIYISQNLTLTATQSVSKECIIRSSAASPATIKGGDSIYPFTIASGGKVTFKDIMFGDAAGAITVASGGEAVIDSGVKITTNGKYSPVYVSGTLTMNDGAVIDGNKRQGSDYGAQQGGGGVTVKSGGIFNMTGGSISNNTSCSNGSGWIGGGICVNAYSTGEQLKISGGSIYTNSAANGGGISMTGGKLTMTGGSIINNVAAAKGGGIYLEKYGTSSSSFDGTNAANAAITGNQAPSGTQNEIFYKTNEATVTIGKVTIGVGPISGQ